MLQVMPAPDRHAHRRQHWPSVLKILGRLPSPMLKQALLLCHTVGLQSADDGQWQHALARPQDPPVLDLHAWLLDDWCVGGSSERRAFEQQLFAAIGFEVLGAFLRRSRRDPHSVFDASDRPLEDELARQALTQWQRAVPEGSAFWAHREAVCADMGREVDAAGPLAASWHAQLPVLPAVATALWAGHGADLPALLTYCELVRAVLQFADHLSEYRRDLQEGFVSPTALDTLLQENHARVAQARRIAVGLALANLQAHADTLDALLHRLSSIAGLGNRDRPADMSTVRAFFAPAPAVLDKVLEKAEARLLADPSFREAWEVQEHSYASTHRIVARVFAPCVIVDILAAHGHNVAGPVKELLETYQSQGFRYYDHTHLLVPDIDSLALALRLVPHARHPGRYHEAFQAPMRWLRENQLPSGCMPVWLRKNDSPPALSDVAVLYGAHCATVEANLMTSLIGSDWQAHRDLVEPCARAWCRRWLDVGLGACGHYTPLYSLWAATELVGQLLAHTGDVDLQAMLRQLGTRLGERLRAEATCDGLSPQDAAFLMLASLRTQALPYDGAWITVLFKHQRHDGHWEGEPFYVVPSGRDLSTQWFKSRSVTTAFIYHALRHHHAALQCRHQRASPTAHQLSRATPGRGPSRVEPSCR